MSTLRLPMLSPPGSATRASPHRASSGPSTLNDARMRVTSSYGASGCRSAGRVDPHDVGLGLIDARADRAQEVAHHVEVEHRRHVAQRRDARREQRGRHLLHARVLGRARDLDPAFEAAAAAARGSESWRVILGSVASQRRPIRSAVHVHAVPAAYVAEPAGGDRGRRASITTC